MEMPKHKRVFNSLVGGAATRSARDRNWRNARKCAGSRLADQRAVLSQCLAFKIGARVRTTLDRCGVVCGIKDDGVIVRLLDDAGKPVREVELRPQQVTPIDNEGDGV